MNKKIIAIGIVSLFLLTGLTTLSAVGMKTNIKMNKAETDQETQPGGVITNYWAAAKLIGKFTIKSISYKKLGNTGWLYDVKMTAYSENLRIGRYFYKLYDSINVNINAALIKLPFGIGDLNEGLTCEFGSGIRVFGIKVDYEEV